MGLPKTVKMGLQRAWKGMGFRKLGGVWETMLGKGIRLVCWWQGRFCRVRQIYCLVTVKVLVLQILPAIKYLKRFRRVTIQTLSLK